MARSRLMITFSKKFLANDKILESLAGQLEGINVTPGLQKYINRTIIYVPGSSHTYIQQNEQYITAHIT